MVGQVLLGLAVADRISDRVGLWTVAAVLLWGPLLVAVWSATGNLLPWEVLQGGGMLLALGDHSVFGWTGGLVSGYSLKHAVAALAAWQVLVALPLRRAMHNGVQGLRHAQAAPI